MTDTIERLRKIKRFDQLVAYLRDDLDWPIESDDFEEVTYDWEAEELGIDPKHAAKIQEIKQLRPLASTQQWGIFFVKFEPKQLPVVVMRRLLNKLVIKKRATAKSANQASWRMHDLLFVSEYGNGNERKISFAHFTEGDSANLPTLKLLDWDADDTGHKLQFVATQLSKCLRWPQNTEDLKAWRAQWASAFTLKHRHVISTAKDLAEQLAALCRNICDEASRILDIENAKGAFRRLYESFRTALIHDLTESDFADMFAQTITYGLFSTAVSGTVYDGERSSTYVDTQRMVDLVPITNPFLKEMLSEFLRVGGRKNKIDFDELGISEVVELLRDDRTNLTAVLRDFGNRGRGEDPVIHFYEDFLKQYNKQLKVQRGVFYTPQPVVSYIVRSVHELLQTEFGLEDGLASTVTWGEMASRNKELKIPEGAKPDDPFVVILDPATGTATFLVEVINIIHRTMIDKWKKEGRNEKQQALLWNEYVPKHLLPRMYGYELMMAPYAIAHIKIGLKLSETGYRFQSKERARIYLTNALEPWVKQLPLIGFDALAHEAVAVNEIKRSKRFTVVIGNPPYARSSSNKGSFIEQLMESYKATVRDERNIQPLSDDYIKFVRLSEHLLRETRVGIYGMITNNTFLSGRIHRGMRQNLLGFFQSVKILNLHGSGNVDFLGTQGVTDENVFDILQGVSIAVLSASGRKHELHYAELVGRRQEKYGQLSSGLIPGWKALEPAEPYFLWIPRSSNNVDEYKEFVSVDRLFKFFSVSGKPGDDNLLVSFSMDEVLPKLQEFRRAISAGSLMRLTEAGRNLAAWPQKRSFDTSLLRRYAYRPFDTRFTYYDAGVWTRAVKPLNACIDGSPVLLTTKIVKDPSFSHVFVTRLFADVIFLSNTSSVNCYSFPSKCSQVNTPLRFGTGTDQNLDIDPFARKLPSVIHNDAFAYIYAVLHSPTYRERYFEALQYDFPRLPLTGNLELFRALARLGGELTALHLLESPRLDQPITEFIGGRKPEVEKVSWSNDTVWVDKAQTTGFRGVREPVWNFHIGGYQVCQKWLKDRKGRTLTKEDIAHYHKIVVALSETIRLMAEIDTVIDKYGGWPGAFITERNDTVSDVTEPERTPADGRTEQQSLPFE